MTSSNMFAAMQLADSFFPTGMFTQSHGLERFVELGWNGIERLQPLFESYVRHVAAPGDALAARWVARAAITGDLDLVAQIDARVEATRLSAEGRLASRRCGGRILLLATEVFGGALLNNYARRALAGQVCGHQSVALALAAHAAGLDEETAVAVELHSFTVSLVSAAIRLGALDHAAGQRLLFLVQPALAEAAAEGRMRDWRTLGSFAPQIDLAQFGHPHGALHMFVS